MLADLTGKRVVVLSDNDMLSTAIALNLRNCLRMEVVKPALSLPQRGECRAELGDLDLIVVAMSSPTSKPIVALLGASLSDRVDQVPLLIISHRSFQADPEGKVFHLDFPFDLDDLFSKVGEILDGTLELGTTVTKNTLRVAV